MANNPSVKRWQDQLILLLGLWFFITPWVFGYPTPSLQAWTAFISGAVMVLLAACNLYKTYFWAVVRGARHLSAAPSGVVRYRA